MNESESQTFVRTKVQVDHKSKMCLTLPHLTRNVVKNIVVAPFYVKQLNVVKLHTLARKVVKHMLEQPMASSSSPKPFLVLVLGFPCGELQ